MLTLINTNRMTPPIAPVGLEYVAGAAVAAGIEVRIVDLCLAAEPDAALSEHFAEHTAELVGLSFRNIDDCFWPSGESFVPDLKRTVDTLRSLTDAPVALGGVGYSILAEPILRGTGAEFGIRGDGEEALPALAKELRRGRRFENVPGLIWRRDGRLRANPPAWPAAVRPPTARDRVNNAEYFRRGGQIGLETKRGCNRRCIYCADPLAKGPALHHRPPKNVADEAEALLAQGADVLHLCDSEFNIPREHAMAVCDEFSARGLGGRIQWYTYMAVTPFDAELARAMRRAGCVGINFTADAAAPAMLAAYRQKHDREDLRRAVRLCRENGIAVMLDLLLGGPGETPETLADTIGLVKEIDPDCAGAPLGLRICPDTAAAEMLTAQAPDGRLENLPGLCRHYDGPVNLLWPTFYISPALGEKPAQLVREIIGGDKRFFEPEDDAPQDAPARDHNYNANQTLADAIAAGNRGAYWHILRRMRG